MAANPKRKGLSTLPVYLPDVPVTRRPAAKQTGEESGKPRIYMEGGFDPSAAEALTNSLTAKGGLDAFMMGEMLAALPRGPQLQFRHAVATAGRGLAAARVRTDLGGNQQRVPHRGEVDQEEASLHARSKPEITNPPEEPMQTGLVYKASGVQEVFRDLLPKPGKAANVVVTSRTLTSWDDGAKAWVARAVVPGNPVVISTGSGVSAATAASLAKQIREALAR